MSIYLSPSSSGSHLTSHIIAVLRALAEGKIRWAFSPPLEALPGAGTATGEASPVIRGNTSEIVGGRGIWIPSLPGQENEESESGEEETEGSQDEGGDEEALDEKASETDGSEDEEEEGQILVGRSRGGMFGALAIADEEEDEDDED